MLHVRLAYSMYSVQEMSSTWCIFGAAAVPSGCNQMLYDHATAEYVAQMVPLVSRKSLQQLLAACN